MIIFRGVIFPYELMNFTTSSSFRIGCFVTLFLTLHTLFWRRFTKFLVQLQYILFTYKEIQLLIQLIELQSRLILITEFRSLTLGRSVLWWARRQVKWTGVIKLKRFRRLGHLWMFMMKVFLSWVVSLLHHWLISSWSIFVYNFVNQIFSVNLLLRD